MRAWRSEDNFVELILSNFVWVPGMKLLEHCSTQLGNVGPFLDSVSPHKHRVAGISRKNKALSLPKPNKSLEAPE